MSKSFSSSESCETINPTKLGLISKKDLKKRKALKLSDVNPVYIRMDISHLDLLNHDDHIRVLKVAARAEQRAKWILSEVDLSSNLGKRVFDENLNVLQISESYARHFIRSYEKYCK